MSELKKLNFQSLLILDDSVRLDTYSFDIYMQNNGHRLQGYCTKCEEKGCNVCSSDNNYRLLYISHGATTDDVLLATGQKDIDLSNWHSESVMFIMENPSVDGWGLYEELEYKAYKKRPAKRWYWIHENQPKLEYPEQFKGRAYGKLFNSIIFTFKLRNAYLTNFVKCGMNNDEGNYKSMKNYDRETIQTCFENYLLKEIEITKPKIIFCFGSTVEEYLSEMYSEEHSFEIVGLPHPARARGGFKDKYYQHLYYSMILEGLYKVGIVSKEEAVNKYGEFLAKS